MHGKASKIWLLRICDPSKTTSCDDAGTLRLLRRNLEWLLCRRNLARKRRLAVQCPQRDAALRVGVRRCSRCPGTPTWTGGPLRATSGSWSSSTAWRTNRTVPGRTCLGSQRQAVLHRGKNKTCFYETPLLLCCPCRFPFQNRQLAKFILCPSRGFSGKKPPDMVWCRLCL